MDVFLEEGEFPNPFEKKDGSAPAVQAPTVQAKVEPVAPAPAVEPVEEKPFVPQSNPLRSGQPIRGTYTTQSTEQTEEHKAPRRYTY